MRLLSSDYWPYQKNDGVGPSTAAACAFGLVGHVRSVLGLKLLSGGRRGESLGGLGHGAGAVATAGHPDWQERSGKHASWSSMYYVVGRKCTQAPGPKARLQLRSPPPGLSHRLRCCRRIHHPRLALNSHSIRLFSFHPSRSNILCPSQELTISSLLA